MNDIMKIVKSLEESGLEIKGVSETIKNEAKEQKFLCMLLGTEGASLLGNLLTDKCAIRAGEGTIRAGQDFSKFFPGLSERIPKEIKKFIGSQKIIANIYRI